MANTKGNTTRPYNKKNTANTDVNQVKAENKVDIKKTVKQKLKLDDSVLISVKSNRFGELIYINHKSGDETRWNNFGDVQTLSVGDLRAMKAKQLTFFQENWITIDGIADSDEQFENVDVGEIYDALQISQYYDEYLCPKDINKVFNLSVNELKDKIPRMTRSVRECIAIRANELIKLGILDSISKVKALEEILECELAREDD